MPLIRPIQPAFSGGEYSPSLWSRIDIEKYKTGLRRCRNFIIHPHGGASNRPGTKFIARTKYADKKARVVRFVFNIDQAYIIEFGHLYIRFYTNQAQIEANVPDAWDNGTNYVIGDYVTYSGGTYFAIQAGINQQPDTQTDYWTPQTIYEVPSPYTEDDLRLLRFESSADVIYITHPDFQQRTLSRFGNAQWELALYSSDDGPFMTDNVTDTTITTSDVTGSIVLGASANLFNSEQVGALWKLRHYIGGAKVTQAFSSATTSGSIKCFTTWRVISHGTWTGGFDVEKSSDGGSTWTKLRSFTSADDFNANTFGTEDISANSVPFLIRINMSSYTSGTANIDLTADPFFQEGIVRLTQYNSATSMNATVLQTIGSTAATKQWAEGSWSDYRGWPAVARFFQDRLCFSGTYSEPMTTWMSVIGDYISFARHSVLLDTDGITVNIPARQINAINGLITLRKLVAFTAASEWTIGPTTGSVLTPNSIEQAAQGYRGSYGIEPAIVGFECIFIQANSKVVRNLQYQLYYDQYTGSDLNILARHLFAKNTIIETAYQQDPDSVVWCLRDDGVLLGMTYMAEQEVIAWHWHDTGGFSDNNRGVIESIACIPGRGFDELWMEVKRGADRFIEVMTKRDVISECVTGERHIRLEDQFFVDCGVIYGENQINITQITTQGDITTITAPLHGLSNGQVIKINHTDPILGLNGNLYTISEVTTNTFVITEVDV